MAKQRFDVFGTEVLIEREQGHWSVYYIGTDGKRHPASDIVIPALITGLWSHGDKRDPTNTV